MFVDYIPRAGEAGGVFERTISADLVARYTSPFRSGSLGYVRGWRKIPRGQAITCPRVLDGLRDWHQDLFQRIRIYFNAVLFLEQSNGLVLRSRYYAYMPSLPSPPRSEPIFACPHRDIVGFLDSGQPDDDCRCGTRMTACLDGDITEPPRARVTRYLGKRNWPADAQWHRQSRVVDYEMFYDYEW